MAWQTPITDRILQDAVEVRQGINNPKGAFQASDWNRILGNELYIQDLIQEWKAIIADINDILESDESSYPTDADLNRLAQNIVILRDVAGYTPIDYATPITDYVGGFGDNAKRPSYIDINIMENDLLYLKQMIQGAIDMWHICGEAICSNDSQQIDVL